MQIAAILQPFAGLNKASTEKDRGLKGLAILTARLSRLLQIAFRPVAQ
jgi:hypothetical protein